jgi:hypothetical protein
VTRQTFTFYKPETLRISHPQSFSYSHGSVSTRRDAV